MQTPDALSLLREHGQTVDAALRRVRARHADAPPRLLDAIDYSMLAGGKRLRPVLVLESCRAVGGSATDPSAVAAAVAIELIHTFSLVHDDLPAMDDDDLRRGRPTNHKAFGEAMAILAGDAMTTLAFEVLATDARPQLVPQLITELARASGPDGMIGGQVLDIDSENQRLTLEQLQRVHRLKTGALLTCACRMGGTVGVGTDFERKGGDVGMLGCGEKTTASHTGASSLSPWTNSFPTSPLPTSPPSLSALTAFGRHLGLAFQIVDDVLDVTSTPEQLGKATGKDAGLGKNTYPGLLGLDASRQMASAELAAAIAAIEPLGPAADGLRALARFVVARTT